MKFIDNEEITPPPGIITSLKSGFDITTNHIGIIMLPIILDIFLWFGPSLRVNDFFKVVLDQFNIFAQRNPVPDNEMQIIQELLEKMIATDINLFGMLRTFPIGISSLMAQALPTQTPLGQPNFYQLTSSFSIFLWFGGLTIIGWFLGSLYFAWVAKVTLQKEEENLTWMVKTSLQATLLALIWTVALFAFGSPILLVFAIFAQINATLAQFALVFLLFFAMWIIVPVFFSVHGIFIKEENAFRSIISGFNLTRFTLPTSSFFVISVFVLSQGFNILWLTPSDSSWMMLVGILGHAFITTALLAASFIYYRDIYIWLELLLEKISSKRTSAQA